MGLGTAYIAGFRWALTRGYERVMEMDADYSHDPKDILRLIDAAETCDLVIGSRYIGGIRILNWSLGRLMLSVSAAYFVRTLLGLPLSDPTSGFKCFRREVLEALDFERLRSNGYSFQIETSFHAWKLGFSLTEIPIIFTEREGGHSKMSARIVYEAFWMVSKLAFRYRLQRRAVVSESRQNHFVKTHPNFAQNSDSLSPQSTEKTVEK